MSNLPHIVQSDQDGVHVVGLVGEFDISVVDLLRGTLLDAVSADRSKLVIDLHAATFLDSMALGTLVSAGKRANGWGGWVRLVAPPANIRKVLRLTEIDTVFGLYDTVEQAAAHVDLPEQSAPATAG